MTQFKKFITLMKFFHKNIGREITAYDSNLRDEMGLSPKQLNRLLKEFSEEFDNIVEGEKNRKNSYKLIEPFELFSKYFMIDYEFHETYELINDKTISSHKVLENLRKFLKDKDEIYQFEHNPFEDIRDLEKRDVFKKLKRFIKNRQYVKMKFTYLEEPLDNLKCIKFLFVENNLYVVYVNNDGKLELGRLSFIEWVELGSINHTFQQSTVEKYREFLEKKLQNSMTLYYENHEEKEKKKTAKLKALPFQNKEGKPLVNVYFQEGMKKFLKSQKFVEELEDKSIIFTLEYTQPIEILRLIKSWVPAIVVLEPEELRDEMVRDLKKALENHKEKK